ncbi:unnamed protein product [Rotaria sordida]|uniref:Uncharacterized protein n=1 Tax=Rotaria sordida TaxID=392033 RepID=A0A814ZCR0_9BILA|nr:unnamed protein product [Rotaria sordida]CAF3899009.1 unnamed protein product [Rotaria sordida]
MPCRNPFTIHKTKPRRFPSRSPLKLLAEEMRRELGIQYQTIDARIGNERMTYDIAQGGWTSGGIVDTFVDTRGMTKLEKSKRELEEDNKALRAKVDILLEMLAEVSAEQELRRSG